MINCLVVNFLWCGRSGQARSSAKNVFWWQQWFGCAFGGNSLSFPLGVAPGSWLGARACRPAAWYLACADQPIRLAGFWAWTGLHLMANGNGCGQPEKMAKKRKFILAALGQVAQVGEKKEAAEAASLRVDCRSWRRCPSYSLRLARIFFRSFSPMPLALTTSSSLA